MFGEPSLRDDTRPGTGNEGNTAKWRSMRTDESNESFGERTSAAMLLNGGDSLGDESPRPSPGFIAGLNCVDMNC